MVRVEDLDTQRCTPQFADDILRDLEWLDLVWDEGPDRPAPYGPNQQSRRSGFYAGCLQTLEEQGLLYPCFCSRAQLHAASAPHSADGVYRYNGRCRGLSSAEAAILAHSRPPALRVQAPQTEVCFDDACQGHYCENLAEACGDFIVQRSDGVFAYQLATPADDGAMGVTEVVRGRDLLSSTPRQIWMLQTLGFCPPRYAHLPLLLAPDGRRLSKRDGDTDLAALRAAGVAPAQITGMLAFLAGILDTPSPATPQQLLAVFGWEHIRKDDILLPKNFRELL